MLHYQNHFLHSCCCEDEGKNFIVFKFYCKVRHNKQTMYYGVFYPEMIYSFAARYTNLISRMSEIFQSNVPIMTSITAVLPAFLTKISILAFNTSYMSSLPCSQHLALNLHLGGDGCVLVGLEDRPRILLRGVL